MRLFHPVVTAYAHCDLPCGVYDPAQARIEAESVKAIMEKYQGNDDPVFRTRALIIKEQRSELVKHHLWVLWTDYFKPPHFEKYPQLHDLFNRATKAAGAAGGKGTVDPAEGQKLLDLIAGTKNDGASTTPSASSSSRLPTSRASPPTFPPSKEISASHSRSINAPRRISTGRTKWPNPRPSDR